MGARNDGTTAKEVLGGLGVVERGSLGIKLHVSGEDARSIDPWIVQVAFFSPRLEEMPIHG